MFDQHNEMIWLCWVCGDVLLALFRPPLGFDEGTTVNHYSVVLSAHLYSKLKQRSFPLWRPHPEKSCRINSKHRDAVLVHHLTLVLIFPPKLSFL